MTLIDSLTDLINKTSEELAEVVTRGGLGSGHHGHAGRPGEVGGSQPKVGKSPIASFRNNVTAHYSGQTNGSLIAYDEGGNYLGHLDWREFEDEIDIAWVFVEEDQRRKGIGRDLIRQLSKEFKGQKIKPTLSTDLGTAFLEGVKGEGIIERHYGPGPHPGTGTDQDAHAGGGGWWQDNPAARGMDWTPGRNTLTAGYKEARVDPRDIAKLPGARGEEKKIEYDHVQRLAELIKVEGLKHKPLIIVEIDGTAHIWEGNHRVRAAIMAGIEINIFGGRILG